MNPTTTIAEITARKELRPLLRYLFPKLDPVDRNRTLTQLAPLYPGCTCLNTPLIVQTLEYISERAAQKKTHYALTEDTGLLYLRGVRGAPFAVISPDKTPIGLTSLHESLPVAVALNRLGFHTFALRYRHDTTAHACEDLAVAITFIFGRAKGLGIDTQAYAVWGSGEGANISAYLASYGPFAFGGGRHPRPGFLAMQYSDHRNHTRQEPPTFVCVGEDDPLCDWQTMKKRIDALAACGIPTQFRSYPGLGHGFGAGIGTPAEGWIAEAAAFWQKHLTARVRRLFKKAPSPAPITEPLYADTGRGL